MEGLTKRTFLFGSFVIALTVIMTFLPKKAVSDMTEAKMEDLAPMTVGNYQFAASSENPKQSYKMDEKTYRLLTPYGIVSRIYRLGDQAYDVVLIAGNNKENFHDPRICFDAQGMQISDDKRVIIPTKTRGNIPVTIVTMTGNGKKSVAAFFYRGIKGFYANTPDLGKAMIVGPLLGQFNTDAVFYRFMPMSDQIGEKELEKFIAEYMDAAGPVSKGFF